MPSFVVYKHGITRLNSTPTGDAGLALNNNLTAIADLFDNIPIGSGYNGTLTLGGLVSWNGTTLSQHTYSLVYTNGWVASVTDNGSQTIDTPTGC